MHIVQAKGILSAKDGMNIYRGCSHGCIYCDSRSECYHIEHDFEDITVKGNTPMLYVGVVDSCLDMHFPGLKEEYIRLYGNNYSINSVRHGELMHLFHVRCKEYGIEDNRPVLKRKLSNRSNLDVIFSYLNTFESTAKPAQLELFFNK